jgi:hypothetical protein
MTKENWRGVVTPYNFDLSKRILPKEQKLIDICKRHIQTGSRVWVYMRNTGKYNDMPRLQKLLENEGIKCGILNASDVDPTEREEWIRANGDKFQVMLSHPRLVSTGLELFMREPNDDKAYQEARYRFNYNVLTFYQTGYNLFDMRQASRRAWRLGQEWDCLVYYLYYRNTMQHRAMELASRKLEAALELEGSFSEDGLAAMSSDSSAQMALCKSLAEKIDANDIQRKWEKIKARGNRKPRATDNPEDVQPDAEAQQTADPSEAVAPQGEATEEADPAQEPGVFFLVNRKNVEYQCRVWWSPRLPQPYIEASPIGVMPTPPPITITQDEVKRDGWRLDVDRIDEETLIALYRDGFTFTDTGTPEQVHQVSKKHAVVGHVPFETGVPGPGVKSPLDRMPIEKQMVAETIISHGFEDFFDEEAGDDKDWGDFFEVDSTDQQKPAEKAVAVAEKFMGKVATKPKSKRAVFADVLDDLFGDEPVPVDDWDF